jgi:hypothetical protein
MTTEALDLLLKLVNSNPESREFKQAINDARWLLAKEGFTVNFEN